MLECRGLGKSYGGVSAVSDVSLQLGEGKLISFIGPNGAGKSTVLNMICRLLPKDAGEVLLDNKRLESYESYDLARRLAILTQSAHFTARITVRELIAFGRFPYSKGHLTCEDNKLIDEAIDFMQLEGFEERFIDELSGGQRQRALIAMVLAQNTAYVCLDEPTNNLDIYHARSLMVTLRRLCDELGKTVVIVLHDLNLASYYSDEIAVFKSGRLLKMGPVAEVMEEQFLKSVYEVDFNIQWVKGRPLALYF